LRPGHKLLLKSPPVMLLAWFVPVLIDLKINLKKKTTSNSVAYNPKEVFSLRYWNIWGNHWIIPSVTVLNLFIYFKWCAQVIFVESASSKILSNHRLVESQELSLSRHFKLPVCKLESMLSEMKCNIFPVFFLTTKWRRTSTQRAKNRYTMLWLFYCFTSSVPRRWLVSDDCNDF